MSDDQIQIIFDELLTECGGKAVFSAVQLGAWAAAASPRIQPIPGTSLNAFERATITFDLRFSRDIQNCTRRPVNTFLRNAVSFAAKAGSISALATATEPGSPWMKANTVFFRSTA
jgi:hypothetical protein